MNMNTENSKKLLKYLILIIIIMSILSYFVNLENFGDETESESRGGSRDGSRGGSRDGSRSTSASKSASKSVSKSGSSKSASGGSSKGTSGGSSRSRSRGASGSGGASVGVKNTSATPTEMQTQILKKANTSATQILKDLDPLAKQIRLASTTLTNTLESSKKQLKFASDYSQKEETKRLGQLYKNAAKTSLEYVETLIDDTIMALKKAEQRVQELTKIKTTLEQSRNSPLTIEQANSEVVKAQINPQLLVSAQALVTEQTNTSNKIMEIQGMLPIFTLDLNRLKTTARTEITKII